MEESFVLDLGDTGVVEVFAVHEATLFGEITFVVNRVVIVTLLARWLFR